AHLHRRDVRELPELVLHGYRRLALRTPRHRTVYAEPSMEARRRPVVFRGCSGPDDYVKGATLSAGHSRGAVLRLEGASADAFPGARLRRDGCDPCPGRDRLQRSQRASRISGIWMLYGRVFPGPAALQECAAGFG